MPELPEIETIKRALTTQLPGRRITKILVRETRLRVPVDAQELDDLVLAQSVRTVERRAKYLLIRLETASTLILHLGMSGQLLWLNNNPGFDKHDHVIFYFGNGFELRFRDPRRFGLVDAIAPGGEDKYQRLTSLGVEPLAPETSSDYLFEKASAFSRPIKNLLMDAKFIVGIGNIYASEALFYAGIHPLTSSKNLTRKDWSNLLNRVRTVLQKAIEQGGTTINDFVNSDGETGYFQLSLAVYGRDGEPCPGCKNGVEKVTMSGRSTFFCNDCQKRR